MAKFIRVTNLIGSNYTTWELGEEEYIPVSHILSFKPFYRLQKENLDLIKSNLDKIPDETIRHHFEIGNYDASFKNSLGTTITLINPFTQQEKLLTAYESANAIHTAIES